MARYWIDIRPTSPAPQQMPGGDGVLAVIGLAIIIMVVMWLLS